MCWGAQGGHNALHIRQHIMQRQRQRSGWDAQVMCQAVHPHYLEGTPTISMLHAVAQVEQQLGPAAESLDALLAGDMCPM